MAGPPRDSPRPASTRSSTSSAVATRPSTQHSGSRPSTRSAGLPRRADAGVQRGRPETKRERAERVRAEARAEAERRAAADEEERLRKKAHEDKLRRIKELADELAREQEERAEEGRRQRIAALTLKLSALRGQIVQAEIVPEAALQAADASEMEGECGAQMSRMRSEVDAMEKAIEDQLAAMKTPGWLQSAHKELRRAAIAALAKHDDGSPAQEAAAPEAAGEEERSDGEHGENEQEVWTGSDEEIAQAQETIAALHKKIERLTERIDQAQFMSDATKDMVAGEILKAKELRARLQAKIDGTMHERKVARLYTLPARPSSSWINLQLLKKQHATLLAHLKPAVSQLSAAQEREKQRRKENAAAVEWQECIDPASGNTYFVHTATNTTQWHPPQGLNRYQNDVLTASNEAAFFNSRGKKLKAVLLYV